MTRLWRYLVWRLYARPMQRWRNFGEQVHVSRMMLNVHGFDEKEKCELRKLFLKSYQTMKRHRYYLKG